MNQIMDEYGASGQVAWVYRHFPIEQLHPNAAGIALASECVADLGGNDAFWSFLVFPHLVMKSLFLKWPL